MKRALLCGAVGGALGAFVGVPMGVVGYGSGLGGAIIFGPIGVVIGFWLALQSAASRGFVKYTIA